MLASMSFLLQFIALAQSLKTLAGSLSVVCRPTPPQSPSPHSFAVSALLPLFRGARVDETTPKCARPAVGMKLVLRAPLLVMSAETAYGASSTLGDTLLGAHGKNPYLTVSVPHPHMKTLSVSLSRFFRVACAQDGKSIPFSASARFHYLRAPFFPVFQDCRYHA